MKTCFFITPIGESGSETRRRSDLILKFVVSFAAEQCGYSALRADQISEPGLITSSVIQHIIDDPLVIAGLTGHNPNVFYELAIRHAVRKPLVQIIRKGEQIPFDVAGMRTISVDHTDLESVDEAKAEIVKQIKAIERNPQGIDTPISVAIDLQSLRQSDNPELRTLAELLSSVIDIKNEIAHLRSSFSESADRRQERDREFQKMSQEIIYKMYKELRHLHAETAVELSETALILRTQLADAIAMFEILLGKLDAKWSQPDD